jgi:hypothetical protein
MRDGGARYNDGLLGCDEILKEAEVLVATYGRESCTLMRNSSRRAPKHGDGRCSCVEPQERGTYIYTVVVCR